MLPSVPATATKSTSLFYFSLFSEGDVKHTEDHQAAKVKGEGFGVKHPSALRRCYHITHDLADLADGTDGSHDGARKL